IGAGSIAFPSVSSWAGTDPRARPEVTARAVAARVTGATARITARLDEALCPSVAGQRVVQAASALPGRAGGTGHGGPGGRTVPAQAGLLGDGPPVPRDDLVRVHRDAARFFRDRLGGSWVPGYLAARGLAAEMLDRWQVGYARAGWSELAKHLREIG